jgi:hypothetical protein
LRILKCHLVSINMWSDWLWDLPSGVLRIIVLLKTRFFEVAKFTVLTSLSLLSWCRFQFPIVVWKYSRSPFFCNLLTEFSHGN